MTRILVVYYSMYGNTFKLAQAIADGVKSAEDTEVIIKRVADLIPPDKIDKIPGASEALKAQSEIKIADPKELDQYDGIIFGSPTRFGNQCAQMKNFIDNTGSLWMKGALAGKPAAVFTGSSTLHGGQETTLITMMIPLLHHGMILVGVPPTVPEVSNSDKGGSYYGASFVTGTKGENPPTENDKKIGMALGKRVAEIAIKLKS